MKKQYLWTDSLVVLGWINSNKLLPHFVANRVNEIKRNHPETEMCYIHTKPNPADIATRHEPELWDQRKELWYGGLYICIVLYLYCTFMKEHESCWPERIHYTTHTTLISFGEGPRETSEEMEVHDWSEVDSIQDAHMEIDDADSMEEVVQNNAEKRWVALFTCLTVRAISLEIVQNISAQECLLALRRFAATRAVPKRIYSDTPPASN